MGLSLTGLDIIGIEGRRAHNPAGL